ncbi:Transcription factor btd [Trichinella pseudospiralis]|uniref:Transcription factor btd n=1 Tax=Trichinella pseudospiralis TaxID=6337 RepID=A0A0V1JWZ7_TRIPS|nr:Transcription factor btd [Trichinella pseudospiralis]KRZ39455.1 Transcription factor btd [Trichinella pseudospiralis]
MHTNIHLGIKPFVCEICGNSFSNDGAKHNHMRTHSNATPFACPLCEKTFSWEMSLKEHLTSHANHGDIKASMVGEIYLQQKRQYKLKKRAEKRREFKRTNPVMLQLSSPENCEGVSLPSTNYETYHEAAAYNLNTSVAAISENENQHPQLQQQQTLSHAIGGLWQNGYSSNNTSDTYNGRYEMISAENTVENGVQWVSLPAANYETYHEAAAYNLNTSVAAISENENQHPQLQQQQTLSHAIGGLWQNGYSSNNTSDTYNGRYEMISAENTVENGVQCRTNCFEYDEGTSSTLCLGNVFFIGAMLDGREDNPFPTQ